MTEEPTLASIPILVLWYSIQKRIPNTSTDDRHRNGRSDQACCGKCSGSRGERDECHVCGEARSTVFHFGRLVMPFPMHGFASYIEFRIVRYPAKSTHGFVYAITACSAARGPAACGCRGR